MPNKARRRLHGVYWYGLVLAGVTLVVLFLQNRSVDIELHGRRMEMLLQLRHLDTTLDRDVLRVSSFLLVQYDPLVATSSELRALTARMRASDGGFVDDTTQEVTAALDEVLAVTEDKLRFLERIKSQSAVLRNGLQYLPIAVEELAAADARLGSRLAHLLNRLYLYNLFPSESDMDALRRELDEVETNAGPVAGAANLLHSTMTHMQAHLVGLQTLTNLRQRYVELPNEARFDALYAAYGKFHAERSLRSDQVSKLLLGATVLLFVLLGLALRRLNRAHGQTEAAWNKLRDAVESLTEAFALFDASGRLVLHNRRYLDLYPWLKARIGPGTLVADIVALNREADAFVDPHEQDGQSAIPCPAARTYMQQLTDGRWYLASDTPTPDGGMACVRVDISERKHAEDKLRLHATVFDSTAEGIMVADAANRIKTVNAAFTRITGFSRDEVVGKNPSVLRSGRHDHVFYEQMWSALVRDGHWSGEIWNRRKDGRVFPEWLSIAAIRNEQGEIHEYVGIFSDVTQRKQDEEKIRRQANFDALTDLPNRTLLHDRLSHAIVAASRSGARVAVLFLDLDRFKGINDVFGHVVGDELLRHVSQRLRTAVRMVDTVARFGGDEFVVVLEEVQSANHVAAVAEKLIAVLAEPIELAGRELFVGASIGITLFPDDSQDPETLLRNADMAMYRAKESGRNCFRFYTASMNEQSQARLEMERGLRVALDRDEFVLEYQPVFACRSGQLETVEALLRWRHPELGLVPPDRFVRVAEESGLIAPIGLWVLRTACRQAARWRREWPQLASLRIAVNLSSRQWQLGLDAEAIAAVLVECELPASALVLEITESMVLEGTEDAIAWLHSIRALGVQLAVDDFGTGYSSLSYLKRFPVGELKIDRSFVRDIPHDDGSASLVRAIISMARSLDLQVVAEGVETEDQHHFLQQAGCDFVQGFLRSRPVHPDRIPELAAGSHATAAPSAPTAR